jgi:hypothetical protein
MAARALGRVSFEDKEQNTGKQSHAPALSWTIFLRSPMPGLDIVLNVLEGVGIDALAGGVTYERRANNNFGGKDWRRGSESNRYGSFGICKLQILRRRTLAG